MLKQLPFTKMATPDFSTSVKDDNQYDFPLQDKGSIDWDVYSKVGSFSFKDMYALAREKVGAESAASPLQLPLRNKVFDFEKTARPVFSMQDPSAKKVSSAKPPRFKARTSLKNKNVISSPGETVDDGADLSNNFEDQFQGPGRLYSQSTAVLTKVSKSSKAARTAPSATPPLNMAMEDSEGYSPEEEIVNNVKLSQSLPVPADEYDLLELPVKSFESKRDFSRKASSAMPPLKANWVPDAVTILSGVGEREAQKSDPHCDYRLEPNSSKDDLNGKLQLKVDKYSVALVCREYKGTPSVEVQGGLPCLGWKELKGNTWREKMNSKKRKREGSEGAHGGKPTKAKKSSRKYESKRGRDFTDSETSGGRKKSRN